MTSITFEGVSKVFDGGKVAVNDIDLHITQGELAVLIGPSGCGKSTILRMVAGLETPSSGNIRFDGDVVNHLSPSERGIGMVFQSYALYPHMSVAENIGFPLRMSGKPRRQIAADVAEVAEMLEIAHLLHAKPRELSGGQRQRVAISRALVRRPPVFLLDEPLSNLDAALRNRMRMNLAEYHRQLGCTIIYVTHDQTEAMTLADRVILLKEGGMEQCGTPKVLYEKPATRFVAEFMGTPRMNMIPANFFGMADGFANLQIGEHQFRARVQTEETIGVTPGTRIIVGIRPQATRLCTDGGLAARVAEYEYMGSEAIAHLTVPQCEAPILVRCDPNHLLVNDEAVNITFDEDSCHLFGPDGKVIGRHFNADEDAHSR